jgi:spermidine/putrescine transport system substrate-binding protein
MFKFLLTILATLLVGCGPKKQQLNEDISLMQTKLAAGGSSIYDVVFPGHSTLPGLIQRGLVAPLRHENIPNLKNVDTQFLNLKFDPGNRYSAPYL